MTQTMSARAPSVEFVATQSQTEDEWVLGTHLRRHATSTPDAPFLTFADRPTLSYSAFLRMAERVGAGLAGLGVSFGDRVVMLMENSEELMLTWFGANLIGAVEVPINTAYRGRTLEHTFNNCAASVAVVDAVLLPRIIESAPDLLHLRRVIVVGDVPTGLVIPDAWQTMSFQALTSCSGPLPTPNVNRRDISAIIYTSGTTGPSKGVLSPHGLAYNLGRQVRDRLDIEASDTFYVCLPLFHSNAQWAQVVAALTAGAHVVLVERFSASGWLQDVRKYDATVSSLLGVMAQFLCAQKPSTQDREHRLRRVLAIPMPANLAQEFPERFGIDCVDAYGMTEISLVLWRPKGDPVRPGSCGKPLTDEFDIAVMDPDTDEPVAPGEVGEIVIRPKRAWTIAAGYHDTECQTVEAWQNLWFHTGDAARVDEDGYYYFVDRIRDRIRRRGENVSSFDIELAVDEYPGVVECAAVGVPAEEGDDEIKLVVVASRPIDVTRLIEHCATRLPYFAVPRYIQVVEKLPKTPTGKILKREIRRAGLTGAEWDRVAAGIVINRCSP